LLQGRSASSTKSAFDLAFVLIRVIRGNPWLIFRSSDN
jgi:hypothetical protein